MLRHLRRADHARPRAPRRSWTCVAERNAFGRQIRSFEEDLDLGLDGGPVRAVFIRAPWIAEHGPDVEVLAARRRPPGRRRQGTVLAISFHPELTGDARLHARFLDGVRRLRDG